MPGRLLSAECCGPPQRVWPRRRPSIDSSSRTRLMESSTFKHGGRAADISTAEGEKTPTHNLQHSNDNNTTTTTSNININNNNQ